MKKLLISILFICIILSGCGNGESNNNNNNNNTASKISFEAYIKEGETFKFEIDPKDCVSYEDLRNAEFKDTLSLDTFDKYFFVGDVYREHYEYDDDGNPTDSYMKGNTISISLRDDKYYYVDNYTRNGLEFKLHVVGEETRVMKNEGTTYDPVVDKIDQVRDYYGADSMIILSDFVNSWDASTQEIYTGHLDSYEVIEASGNLYLMDNSLIQFKKLKDNIYYFAAYGAEDEYFIIFIQTDDNKIAYDKEYDGIVYYTSGHRKDERYTGYKKIILWQMLIDLMKQVNE